MPLAKLQIVVEHTGEVFTAQFNPEEMNLNQDNAIVDAITDAAGGLDFGVFKMFEGDNADRNEALVNWGIAAAIWLRSSSETRSGSRNARETVIAPTPARRATSAMVGRPPPRLVRCLVSRSKSFSPTPAGSLGS